MANVVWTYILLLYGIIIVVTKGQDYEYQNCYYDFYNGRILKDLTDCSDTPLCDCSIESPFCEHNLMTIGFCEDLCRRKNYKYFGLQAGNQCFCGGGFSNTGRWIQADTTGALQRCTTPCLGDPDQECGGDYLMRVFRFKAPLENSACFHPGPPGDNTVTQTATQDQFFDVGETIQYTCARRDYKIIGVAEIECHTTGQWTSSPPSTCQCCAAQCSPPSLPQNAFQSGGSTDPNGIYYEQETVTFICSNNFNLFTIRCINPGTWTDPGNPCTDPTTTTPPTTTMKTTTTQEPTTRRVTTAAPRPVTPFRCPSISCGFCPYGFQQDHLGCYICQCLPPPFILTTDKPTSKLIATIKTTTPRRGCAPITCNKYCPYGLQVDIYGCTACQCVPPPPGVQTTSKTTQSKDMTSAKTLTSKTDISTKTQQGTFPPVINTKTFVTARPDSNTIDAVPFIVGGVALMVLVLAIVLIVNCKQSRKSKKRKGPPPPPPDYPTLDKNHQGHSKDQVYDFIKEPKHTKRKNKYVQNDIPNAPPPPTISQNVSQQQFSDIHSLNRSMVGTKGPPHSHSLSRSVGGGSHTHNSHSLNRSTPGSPHTTHSLGLNRSKAGGYHTPNSHSLSRSLGRNSHSLNTRSQAGNAQYAHSLSRSDASGSHTNYSHSLSRSVASDTQRSHHRSKSSGQNTPRSHQRSIMVTGPYTPNTPQGSMASGLNTPTSHHRSTTHGSHRHTPQNTPLNSRHQNNPISAFSRTQSMYGNIPPSQPADQMTTHGSLDRLNRNSTSQGNEMYMNTMKYNSAERPRPPQRAPSTEISSVPGIHQERVRKSSATGSLRSLPSRRGHGLRINTQMKPNHSLQRRAVPPDSPFGDNHLEMTTQL